MSAMVSQITDVPIVCLTVCSGAEQRKHQSSASLAFGRGIPRWPVDSPHKELVTRSLNNVIVNEQQGGRYASGLQLCEFINAVHKSGKSRYWIYGWRKWLNTLRPEQNGRYFTKDMMNWIFLTEKCYIWTHFEPRVAPTGPINNW